MFECDECVGVIEDGGRQHTEDCSQRHCCDDDCRSNGCSDRFNY